MADAVQVLNGVVAPLGRGAAQLQGLVHDGEEVAFRVMEALPRDHYVVSIKQQRVTVFSRIPLEIGGRYLAEAITQGGNISLLFKSAVPSPIEDLMTQRQDYQLPLGVLFKKLLPHVPQTSVLRSDCTTPEAVKQALKGCGIFYETRLKELLAVGKPLSLLEDLKGYLLEIAGRKGAGTIQETMVTVLKNLEFQQLISSQSGPDGPLFFWLPFFDSRLVEGFVKRSREQSGAPRFLITLRIPFRDHEELLVTLNWRPGNIDVHLACGPESYALLRPEISTLEEQIRQSVSMKAAVNVNISSDLPKHLQEELKGIRFFESYG